MIVSKSDLRSKIVAHFNLIEFKSLCFDLSNNGVNFDDLPGETLTTKVEELIGFLDRRQELHCLVYACSALRPKISWYKKPSELEEWIIGKWQGKWNWRGRQRVAELIVPATFDDEVSINIKYTKSGIQTEVEQTLLIKINNNNVELVGSGYRFIEKGNAIGYHLDRFNLIYSEKENILTGYKVDKREIKTPTDFKKLN